MQQQNLIFTIIFSFSSKRHVPVTHLLLKHKNHPVVGGLSGVMVDFQKDYRAKVDTGSWTSCWVYPAWRSPRDCGADGRCAHLDHNQP